MASILLIERSGTERLIEAPAGHTLMEAIRNAGADELSALCGGCCSCATCHVHIETAFLSALPAPSNDETDLLDFSQNRNAQSRLSCQIRLTDAMSGMRVRIAAED